MGKLLNEPTRTTISYLHDKIIVAYNYNNNKEISFTLSTGEVIQLCHTKECCTEAFIEQITGNLDDLLDTRIIGTIIAPDKITANDEVARVSCDRVSRNILFTLKTDKGRVTIHWALTSNEDYLEENIVAMIYPAPIQTVEDSAISEVLINSYKHRYVTDFDFLIGKTISAIMISKCQLLFQTDSEKDYLVSPTLYETGSTYIDKIAGDWEDVLNKEILSTTMVYDGCLINLNIVTSKGKVMIVWNNDDYDDGIPAQIECCTDLELYKDNEHKMSIVNAPLCIGSNINNLNFSNKPTDGFKHTDIWHGDIGYVITRAYRLGHQQGIKQAK